jgi:dTDP-4-amino-4,6-dideoxygalactose transaminase
MNNVKQKLEQELAALAQRTHCLLVSRGATGLYVAYSAIKKIEAQQRGAGGKSRIIVPSIMCHSPANTAIYAGLELIFCDVNPVDYTLDPHCLEMILRDTPEILAVLSVSIFGHAPNMKAISEICNKYDVYLIDDAAQSIGGSSDKQPSGSWGDIGIYSFGHTKLIDVQWGGAILTNDSTIYEACKATYEGLNLLSPAATQLRTLYSETYYTVEKLENKAVELAPLFWSFPHIFRDLYVYKEISLPENKMVTILEALTQLKRNNDTRMHYWQQYREQLQEQDALQFPILRDGSTPWRFTCRIKKEKRALIVNELRAQKIDVSTWYPSLQKRFPPAVNLNLLPCHTAEVLNDELLNLWIDPAKTNSETIKRTCELVNKLLSKP